MLTEYGIQVQRLFLEMILCDATSYTRISNIYNPENFDRSLRPAAEFIRQHSDQHKTMPDRAQIFAVTGISLEPVPDLNDGHYEWFMTEFEAFTKRQELERAILKAADMLEKGEFDPVEKLIKDAVQISLTKDMGTDYWDDPKARINKYFNSGGQVSTGWPQMDRLLYGGFSRGELNIFAGGSGCVTGDTLVEIIDLPMQFYTLAQIDTYATGNDEKAVELYKLAQPKRVPIGTLMQKVHDSHVMVSSPDGWVPVTDCLEKIKDLLYKFEFLSGRRIVASHDHLYQKPDLSWHYARDLKVGDVLLSESESDVIKNIVPVRKKTKVYDLSVGHKNHRYYTNGICSHNSGKSLVMMNMALNWLQAGLSGVYITLELSEELTSLRTDAMLTNMSTKDIRRDMDTTELKVKMMAKKSGHYQVKGLPAQSNINDIRAYLKEYQIQTGRRVDFVMVDYLDLLMPVSAKVSPNDLFVKDKYVSEELRNLAKELGILMVTASQLNRSAVEEVEFDHSHISGGISKINTADNVFGIFTSRAMKERGKYQIQCMKSRSSTGVGQKIDLEYNIETMRITDAGIDTQSESGFFARKGNIYENIKAKSQVTEPGQDEHVPKVTADVQSSKLKQLLGSIKQQG